MVAVEQLSVRGGVVVRKQELRWSEEADAADKVGEWVELELAGGSCWVLEESEWPVGVRKRSILPGWLHWETCKKRHHLRNSVYPSWEDPLGCKKELQLPN